MDDLIEIGNISYIIKKSKYGIHFIDLVKRFLPIGFYFLCEIHSNVVSASLGIVGEGEI